MSRSSVSPQAPARLVVTADPGTEIFVIDHTFQLRARGVGRLTTELEPGLYKLRYRAGLAIREEYQAIEPGGMAVHVTAPRVAYSSAAPLVGTRASEEHQSAASQLSREVHASAGLGSEVFVFAGIRPGPAARPHAANPLAGLSLHDQDGALLVKLGKVAQWPRGGAARLPGGGAGQYAGCTVALPPGSYRLRYATRVWGHLEQVVVTSPGWQTQVFLAPSPAELAGDRAAPSGLDPLQTSVLHARIGQGFDADRKGARLTDLARVGLANHRAIVRASDLLEIMSGPSDNPMLGIYGAHALLTTGALDNRQLGRIVEILRSLLGPHPDVEALALAFGPPVPPDVFDCPPMLASSWSAVLEAAKHQSALVPLGSLAERASLHLWGSGPWLLWLTDEMEVASPARSALDLPDLVADVAGAALLGHPNRQAAVDVPELTDMEEALLSRVTQPFVATAALTTHNADDQQARLDVSGELVDALGVPPAAIPSVAASLVPKLERAALAGARIRNTWQRLRGLYAGRRLRSTRGGAHGKRTWGHTRRYWLRTSATFAVAGLWLTLVSWALTRMVAGNIVTSPVDAACASNAFSCEFLSGSISVVLSIGLGYLLFLWNLSRVQRPYLDKSRNEPQRVVQTRGSLVGDVVGRDELCHVIIGDLRDRDVRRPHMIIGGLGAGKTALLVRLTSLLAENGAIPVPVRLRDAQAGLDFRELARRQFVADDNVALLSGADGEKIWRQLYQDDKIVVLADGLEEALLGDAMAGERDNLIRLAVRQANERRLPLIIASRPHVPLRDMEATVVELEPLSEAAALEYLRHAPDEDERLLGWVVETAGVAEAPIYLQIGRQLQLAGLLARAVAPLNTRGLDDGVSDRAGLRLRLLKTWTQALIDGHFAAGVPLGREDRQATVDQLSVLACLGLRQDRLQVSFDEVEAQLERKPPPQIITALRQALGDLHRPFDIRLAATRGMRLGLVDVWGNEVRFPHSIMQAYLGSRLIDIAMADEEYRAQALTNPGRELLIALVMNSRANVQETHPEKPGPEDRKPLPAARLSLTRLLHEKAIMRRDVTALYLYAAALQIDSASGAPRLGEIATDIAGSWPEIAAQDQRSLGEAKLNLVRRFGETARTASSQRPKDSGSSAESAYLSLYRIVASEPSHQIRMAGAQEIGAGGDDAFNALTRHIGPRDEALTAQRQAGHDLARPEPTASYPLEGHREQPHWHEQIVRAWLAPLLVRSVTHNTWEVRENLQQWLEFASEGDGTQRGPAAPLFLQVALAQGFKYAANRRGRHANPETWAFLFEQARTMLSHSSFWFTRLTLIHALCLWSLTDGPAERSARRHDIRPGVLVHYWLDRSGSRPEHPFVAEACQLAIWAMETSQPERFIWIDEGSVVSRIGSWPVKPEMPRGHKEWISSSAGWAALHPSAQRLLSDVLLLLNLAQRGEPPGRGQRLEHINRSDVPPCLTRHSSALDPVRTIGRAQTSEPGSNCVHGCAFQLCPYPPKGEEDFQIELSEAFCRRQQALASRGLARRRVTPLQAALPRDLRKLWRQMEQRAQSSGNYYEFGTERAARRERLK